MQVYIDDGFRCHTLPGEGLEPVESEFFDDKCSCYIEGYRFIPAGRSWTRSDGVVFTGEMITPAEDSRILEVAQSAYEEAMAKAEDIQEALNVIYSGEVTL